MPMKKVSVTYIAPPGDAKVTEMFGHTLHDGHAEEIELTERELEKLKGNSRMFKLGKETDADDSKPDPQAEKATREAAEEDDKRKREAQGYSPQLRGAQINPPGDHPPEETDEAKREAQRNPNATRGASGGRLIPIRRRAKRTRHARKATPRKAMASKARREPRPRQVSGPSKRRRKQRSGAARPRFLLEVSCPKPARQRS